IAVDARQAIRFINPLAEELLQAKEHELLGKDAQSVVRLTDPERLEESSALDMALREGRVTSSPGGALLERADGSEVAITYSAAPVLGHRGQRAGAVLVFREASRSRDGRQAEQGELRRHFEHEINSPLTYNLGALSLARRELDALRSVKALGSASTHAEASAREGEERLQRLDRLLQTAHEGASRVASVMGELRSSSPLEQRQRALEPEEVLDLAIGLCGSALEHVRLSRQTSPAPVVLGNRWQLARMLADEVKATVESFERRGVTEGGVLELHTDTDDRGWARIRIGFSGGLAASDGVQAPAFRAHEEDAITHGGSLVVREEPGGRIIELSLPPMDVAHKEPQPTAEGESAARRGSVLIVDDEPMIGRVLEITLQREHDIASVHSAEAALALLERGDAFDVILCDLSMPGMGGRELYERLLATRPDLAARVIFMSGGARTPEDERFLAGMRAQRLDKPFRTDQLAPLIAACVQARERERHSS
ncbi:MAG: response regulator, partial [Polyangiaceae bacterium]|nr:response regulator [Polyangiaceae bacterium]